MKGLVVLVVSASALILFAGSASAQDAKIEKGKQVYTDQNCSMCHSIEGKGNAKGSLDGVGSKLSGSTLARRGRSARGGRLTLHARGQRQQQRSRLGASFFATGNQAGRSSLARPFAHWGETNMHRHRVSRVGVRRAPAGKV